jgi:hypothetical protein
MTYALNAPGDDGSIAKLVQNHAGSCESWARYFQDQYKAQGLAGAANAVKIAGWQLQDETVAVNHAGDSIWMGLAVALAGNNNQAAVVNGGATDLGVAGGGYVNAGKYCQGANKGTNSGDTAIFANGTIQWMVADHAVCLLQDGNDLVLYDTSWGGRSAANTGYVLANTAMPTAGTTSNYIKTDQFVSVYFLNVFDYIEGTIQLVNPVSESSELVPASNFDNNGAAPNTLNVVWLAIK